MIAFVLSDIFFLDRFGVKVVCMRIKVGEDRNRVLIKYAYYRSHVGYGRDYYLVAFGNSERAERCMNSRGAGRCRNTIFHAIQLRHFFAESLYLCAAPVKQCLLLQRFGKLGKLLISETLTGAKPGLYQGCTPVNRKLFHNISPKKSAV